MRKTLLVLTAFIFIAACSAGGGGRAMSTPAPLPDEYVCDLTAQNALYAQIDTLASSITLTTISALITYLEAQAPDCSSQEIIGYFSYYVANKPLVKICGTTSTTYVEGVVKAAIQNNGPLTLASFVKPVAFICPVVGPSGMTGVPAPTDVLDF